jgi:hypothetical protein
MLIESIVVWSGYCALVRIGYSFPSNDCTRLKAMLSPDKETSTLIIDDGVTRIRISNETLARLSNNPPAKTAPPANQQQDDWSSALVVDEPGGTRIRVPVPPQDKATPQDKK